MAFSKHPIQKYHKQRNLSPIVLVRLVVIAALIGSGIFLFFTLFLSDDRPRSRNEAMATLSYLESQGQVTPLPVPTETPAPLIAAEQTERRVIFPHANTSERIVPVYLKNGNWDVSNLQQLVGHLERTAWLDRPGNIVLAGHFEDEYGDPGPFRYLYYAEVGDQILLQEDDRQIVFEVTEVFSTTPDNLEVLRNTPTTRLTLITCDDWNVREEVYDERLIVIAEPVNQEVVQ